MTGAISSLRARVRIERPVAAYDELGGAAVMWTEAGQAWAAIAARTAGAAPAHDGVRSWTGFRVTLRAGVAVRPGWRLVWGARVLRIVGVLDDGAAFIDLHCEEERP